MNGRMLCAVKSEYTLGDMTNAEFEYTEANNEADKSVTRVSYNRGFPSDGPDTLRQAQ